MRELKIRAWNTKRECWTSRVELNGGYGEPLRLEGEKENEGGYTVDNIVIEQYTGLKDKNGKEIYEGDIVKINKGKWGKDGEWVARKELHKGVFIVEYDELNANFVSISKEDENEEELLSFADKLYEVIGNIHENPELLGGEE